MIEKAQIKPIDEIFKSYYEIPEYQREYSWKENNWDNLYNDIDESDKDYFLGSLICIIDGENNFKVVDGQQRLTTLSIFRLAILKKLKDNREYFLNDIVKDNRYSNLLISIFDVEKEKNKLTLQGNNKDEYKFLINKMIKEENKKIDERKRINKAYNFFYEKIDELNVDEIFVLLNKINSSTVVRIEVKTDQDAFILFESINNRGKPLSPIDLIKNKLFANLKNIEQHNTKWQEILENIEDYSLQVRFIRQFYNMFKGRGVSSFDKNIFSPVNNIPKATVTNIITIFDNWIKPNTSEEIFNSLINASKIYKKLIDPKNSQLDGYNSESLNNKLEDLSHLGVAPSYALLMYLIDRKIELNELLKILNIIEKWFIRRHLTNNPSTGKLDQIFMDIVNQIEIIIKNEDETISIEKSDKSFIEIIENELLKEKTPYNTINEINSKLSGNIYDDNSSLTMYLLVMLERNLNGWINREDVQQRYFWDTFKDNTKITPVWSIEHILPQSPKKETDWFDWWIENEMENYVHKIGNLTLTGFNGRLSNKSFKDKKELEKTIVKDTKTIIELVGYTSGKIKLNDTVKDEPKWTKTEINKRTDILISEIIKMLKYSYENDPK